VGIGKDDGEATISGLAQQTEGHIHADLSHRLHAREEPTRAASNLQDSLTEGGNPDLR
jgi:hypothetical protein